MSHIEPFRTDRREIPWRAVALRDESILDLPPNHPLPNGHLWDSMGIYGRQQTHTICASLVSKVLRMVRGLRTQAKPHLWPAPSKTMPGELKMIELEKMRKPRWNPNANEWLFA